MDNAILATGLAFVVSVLTSLFKNKGWSDKEKTAIATGLSILGGIATVGVDSGDWSAANLAGNAVAIFGASQIVYRYILSGTKLDKALTDLRLFGADHDLAAEAVRKMEEVVDAQVAATPKKTTAGTKKSATSTSKP